MLPESEFEAALARALAGSRRRAYDDAETAAGAALGRLVDDVARDLGDETEARLLVAEGLVEVAGRW